MALSDLWTEQQINAVVRRELMDPTGSTVWSWNDVELNMYISDWQNMLQHRFEFSWGSATTAVAAGTQNVETIVTLTAVATDMIRPGNIWWYNTVGIGTGSQPIRLKGRDREELEILMRDWRAAEPGYPQACYQNDDYSIGLYPVPMTSGTLIIEYPRQLTFATNTSPMEIPAWTRYSAVNYCAYRAYSRPGPQNDLNRAERYKAKFIRQGIRMRTMWDSYLPKKAPSIRPGGRYEGDILTVGAHNTLFQTWF